jgi:hypothetical protein
MAKLAQTIFENHRAEVDVLDLSLLTSEYGKVIYPCKGCLSPAMSLFINFARGAAAQRPAGAR